MTKRTRARGVVAALVLVLAAALSPAPAAAQAAASTFRVEVVNVSKATGTKVETAKGPKPIPLSPGAFAVYTGDNPVFEVGSEASEGLEDVAEDGFPAKLARRLQGLDRVTDSGTFANPAGPKKALEPGMSASFTVTAEPGAKLSFATMFVPSNDAFYGPAAGIALFDDRGEPVSGDVTGQVAAYDAGTEVNQEFYGPATKPMQPRPDFGTPEGSVVKPVGEVEGPQSYPPSAQVIRVTVSVVERPSPGGALLPAGYVLDQLVTGLDFPTGIAMNGRTAWVSEAGIPPAPGGPKVKEIRPDGTARTILSPEMLPKGTVAPPFIDVTFDDGWLWLSHRQPGVHGWVLGAISKFRPEDPAGTFTTVLKNLPSAGDHHTNEIVFDPSGRAYFTQGSATNAAVVGLDNLLITGWLGMFPDFHDFPAKDVVLSGKEYTTRNPLTDDPDDQAVTAPFMPFGSGPVEEGTVVQGAPTQGITIGNGTAYSFDPAADDAAASLRLEAWGLRNPFGVGVDPFDPDTLFISNNGADVRTKFSGDRSDVGDIDPGEVEPIGSRPIAKDYDDLFTVGIGGDDEFLGWPDYYHDGEDGDVLPITDPMFCDHPLLQPGCEHDFVLDDEYRAGLQVGRAFAQLEEHSSANKFDFSTSERFGHVGDLFVAETGSFVPITGALEFRGYKVVRVDRATGESTDFVVNDGDTVEELFEPEGFNKPIDVKFADDVMFIVDFGVFEPGLELAKPGTGKVWLVAADDEPINRLRGCTITGTDGDDVLRGSDGRDVICGGGGDDTIAGRGGNDVVFAGRGDDRVHGGHGNDLIWGGAGHDLLWGDSGNDRLHGQHGDDRLNGGRGADRGHGGAGNDDVRGGRGPDVLSGGSGHDDVYGDRGDDRLSGDEGDDLLHGSQGSDSHDGGEGSDTCNGAAGFDSARHCERLLNMEQQVAVAMLE